MSKVEKYPPELTDAVWQKKKSAPAGKTGVGDELPRTVS